MGFLGSIGEACSRGIERLRPKGAGAKGDVLGEDLRASMAKARVELEHPHKDTVVFGSRAASTGMHAPDAAETLPLPLQAQARLKSDDTVVLGRKNPLQSLNHEDRLAHFEANLNPEFHMPGVSRRAHAQVSDLLAFRATFMQDVEAVSKHDGYKNLLINLADLQPAVYQTRKGKEAEAIVSKLHDTLTAPHVDAEQLKASLDELQHFCNAGREIHQLEEILKKSTAVLPEVAPQTAGKTISDVKIDGPDPFLQKDGGLEGFRDIRYMKVLKGRPEEGIQKMMVELGDGTVVTLDLPTPARVPIGQDSSFERLLLQRSRTNGMNTTASLVRSPDGSIHIVGKDTTQRMNRQIRENIDHILTHPEVKTLYAKRDSLTREAHYYENLLLEQPSQEYFRLSQGQVISRREIKARVSWLRHESSAASQQAESRFKEIEKLAYADPAWSRLPHHPHEILAVSSTRSTQQRRILVDA